MKNSNRAFNVLLVITGFVLLGLSACKPTSAMRKQELKQVQAGVIPDYVQGNIYPNKLTDLQRLGRWNHGKKAVGNAKTDPSGYFDAVPTASLARQTDIYVMVHGWAPGFKNAVHNAEHYAWWWKTGIVNAANGYASTWAWSQTTIPFHNIHVSDGVMQNLTDYNTAQGRRPAILAFSWIDQSATVAMGAKWSFEQASISEAYTTINGIRLANALKEAIGRKWGTELRIHLIGHSHGTKVATMAAQTLISEGLPVHELVICDSPEEWATLSTNSANLLGAFFGNGQLNPAKFSSTPISGSELYISNYVSEFGEAYTGDPAMQNIAQLHLFPGVGYDVDKASERHAYSVNWYAGAYKGSGGKYGFNWPPGIANGGDTYKWYQDWGRWEGRNYEQQFVLGEGLDGLRSQEYDMRPFNPEFSVHYGCVNEEVGKITLNSCGDTDPVMVGIAYKSGQKTGKAYGLSFTLEVDKIHPEDRLVASGGAVSIYDRKLATVIDGATLIANGQKQFHIVLGSFWAYLNDDVVFYYVPHDGRGQGTWSLSNFSLVEIPNAKK